MSVIIQGGVIFSDERLRPIPKRFIPCDREQMLLLPPNLLDWLPEDHLARFVIDPVGDENKAFSGIGRQGTEINITVGPRNF